MQISNFIEGFSVEYKKHWIRDLEWLKVKKKKYCSPRNTVLHTCQHHPWTAPSETVDEGGKKRDEDEKNKLSESTKYHLCQLML